MTSSVTSEDEVLSIADLDVHLLSGGSGRPVVVLHHDIGSAGWVPFHEGLSKHFSVYIPDLPGYGQSERPDWARHPRDIAILTLQLISHVGITDTTLVGLGFGGWVAAEMATMAPESFKSLVLAAPFGIKPQNGEILDQMMLSHIDYVKAGFRDDSEFERRYGSEVDPELALTWDLNREMTARIAWKPYMFSHQLPHLLRGVSTPTLIVWGDSDRVVPAECGELYAAALPNAKLVTLAETGHFIELEQPQELARLVVEHVGV